MELNSEQLELINASLQMHLAHLNYVHYSLCDDKRDQQIRRILELIELTESERELIND